MCKSIHTSAVLLVNGPWESNRQKARQPFLPQHAHLARVQLQKPSNTPRKYHHGKKAGQITMSPMTKVGKDYVVSACRTESPTAASTKPSSPKILMTLQT